MITNVEEMRRVHEIYAECLSDLAAVGFEVTANVEHGAMIEVPAAVWGLLEERIDGVGRLEVIATRYANPHLALRALEQTVSATLLASTPEHDRSVTAAARNPPIMV